MKPKSNLRLFLLAAGSSLLAISSAYAQSWSGTTDGDWLTTTNWTGGVAAGSTTSTDTDIAVFNVNANNTIGINMTTAGGNYYLGAIDNTNATARVFQNSSGTTGVLTLNGATVNSVANTILRNSTTTLLTIGNSGSGTLGLALGNATNNVIQITGTGGITINSIISGGGGITRQGAGAGTLTLSGNNSYTGVTSSNSTIIVGSNNALGSTAVGSHTTISATGGIGANAGRIGLNSGINTAENITITGLSETGGGYNPVLYTVSGTGTFSGTITLAGTGSIRIGAGTTNWTGTITQVTTTHGLVFQGTNSVSNAMTINGGALTILQGTTTLNAASGTGIGGTTLDQAGILKLGITNAINTGADLSFGTTNTNGFDLSSFNQTVRGLVSSGGSNTRRVFNSSTSTTSTLTVGSGGGNYSFNGTILNNTGTGGTVALTKTGTGTQTLTGANTYTGATLISDGTLQIGSAGTTGSLSASSAITNNGTLAFSRTNAITQGTDFASTISGTGGVSMLSTGTLTLNGNNSYAGVTAISNGIIAISHANALGTTAGNTTIAATGASTGAMLQLSGGITSAENITITGATETSGFNGAIRNQSGNNTLSGTIVLSSPTNGIRFDTAAGNLIFSGNISQTGTSRTLALTPIGGSTITINNPIANNGGQLLTGQSGVSPFTAGTVILKGVNATDGTGIGNTLVFQGSTLQLGVTNALNTTGTLSVNADTGQTSTFDLASFNQTVNALGGGGTAANSNRRVINSVAGTAILTVGNGGGTGTFNGQINTGTGNIQLIKTGVGTQTLNDQNSYTGGTQIDNGILTLGHATDTLANGGAVNVNGGTLALGTNTDTVGAVTLTSGSITSTGTALQGVLTGTGSAYDVRSGTISAKLGGTVGLTKSTGGTVTLTGDNTYSGATQITGGTLSIGTVATPTGSINNSAVTVNGGTFRYNSSVAYTGTLTYTSGTIGGTNLTGSLDNQVIGANRTLSPGNSPGTANTTNQTWDDGGSYVWEINNATGTAGSDPGWDLENGTGTLDITSTSGTPFNIYVTSLGLDNLAGALTNFNSATSYNWKIADFLSVTGFASNLFNIDTANFTNNNTINGTFAVVLGNTGSIGGDSSQIYLTYTAVPEPGVALIGSLGLLALLRRRRS